MIYYTFYPIIDVTNTDRQVVVLVWRSFQQTVGIVSTLPYFRECSSSLYVSLDL